MDHLQQPLQPLMDNLEGETYEGFEKDPIKYRQYEEAVYRALCDRSANDVTCVVSLSFLSSWSSLTIIPTQNNFRGRCRTRTSRGRLPSSC